MAPKRAAESESSTDFSKELDKKKSVTVRQFNGMNLVDIREFYIDKVSGEKKPGKKGIALSESAWKELVRLLDEVNDALDALNGGKRKKVEEKPDLKPDEKKNEEENDEKEKDEERERNVKEQTVKTEEE
ncbi:CIC11C00000003739 [Sungouiella intermedia]|uniref:CIC11C00000003739 n=1 Tax=Sungouiella intermedia TaxID=45354 RepID=A0A1L0BH39_9ASCO|nr:CIC11C00000003739 [[Candida] intermedia]